MGEWEALIARREKADTQSLFSLASRRRRQWYGDQVYVRGLIECTNICKNNCYYCGIRRGNRNVSRYRLDPATILACCEKGYRLGFRTFVLQGGEDPWFTPERVAALVEGIKSRWPDCAVTLSLGEHTPHTYRMWFEAGADRYLLRHETADESHYGKLHPEEMSFSHRMACLHTLRDIGYQVGAGFMVGSPGQTAHTLAQDLFFLQQFRPQMVGIGPFIPQKDTPFGREKPGTLEDTLCLLALIRLALPQALLPATTALGTIHPQGRELGILAGANVIMPNLSPSDARETYTLYDNKLHTGAEAAENLDQLRQRLSQIGCQIPLDRGDAAGKPYETN